MSVVNFTKIQAQYHISLSGDAMNVDAVIYVLLFIVLCVMIFIGLFVASELWRIRWILTEINESIKEIAEPDFVSNYDAPVPLWATAMIVVMVLSLVAFIFMMLN